ncbi:methionine aminopeptidase [Luteipulveratus sp. YIM 133132]|uniref:Methionine aminopeptidase n=1 Tax=Luteipulveratus flavus TaxID=3031728 RepID=A0ABT6C3C5_9MICO|nr:MULTISPECIES: methionine aminopeptidase [unclassified Luteipulveratus]MDE9367490.1 methionine aminopeptidase [Luteipulveratus sp. YIM 133132]MDF8263444.1 methionine aminopeptidase [Luteipulveratus sp. YIM 133296]
MAYWYNVSTGRVEEDGSTDPKGELMGPYDTQEQAQAALATAQQKTEQWDKEDRAWEQDGR